MKMAMRRHEDAGGADVPVGAMGDILQEAVGDNSGHYCCRGSWTAAIYAGTRYCLRHCPPASAPASKN